MCTVRLFLMDYMILQLTIRLCKQELNVMVYTLKSARVYLPIDLRIGKRKVCSEFILFLSMQGFSNSLFVPSNRKENALPQSDTTKIVELPLSLYFFLKFNS